MRRRGPGLVPGAPLPSTSGRSASQWLAVAVLLDQNGLDRCQIAVLDAVATELVEVHVAVLVDRVGARDALLVLRLVHLVDHRLAVAALAPGALHGIEREAHRLIPVNGVRLRASLAVSGLEVLE